MKIKIVFIVLLFLIRFQNDNFEDLLKQINDKTWFSEDNWAGEQLVFYKTKNGLEKCIWQKHGSGVYVTQSVIFDIEITKDTICLRNGLDLLNNHEIKNFELIFNKHDTVLISTKGSLRFKIFSLDPLIYNWQGDYLRGEKIPIEKLKGISIHKKQIYPERSFQ
jgi:hypothetical protein